MLNWKYSPSGNLSRLKGVTTTLSLTLCLTTTSGAGLRRAQPEEVGMSSERLARLDYVIDKAILNGDLPGAIVLAARKGKIVYLKSFGKRAVQPEAEEMTTDTIFDVASLTKVVVTATSILMLVEDGEIALTDPVSDYVSDFGKNGKNAVTILQLLTHYSGLRPDLDLDGPWEGYDKAVELAFREKLVAEPGERFIYSDINYIILGEMVRVVSGMSGDEFARKRIFEPLGMRHSRFNPPEVWRPKTAPTEIRDGSMLRGLVHDPTASRMGGVAGHAGLFSTIEDIAIFAQMILNRGTINGSRILSPLMIDRMTSNQSPPDTEDWRGLGFDVNSRFSTTRGDIFPIGSYGHTGFTGTSLWIDPATQSFVVLFTSRLHPNGEGDVVSLRKKVASVVAASIIDDIDADTTN